MICHHQMETVTDRQKIGEQSTSLPARSDVQRKALRRVSRAMKQVRKELLSKICSGSLAAFKKEARAFKEANEELAKKYTWKRMEWWVDEETASQGYKRLHSFMETRDDLEVLTFYNETLESDDLEGDSCAYKAKLGPIVKKYYILNKNKTVRRMSAKLMELYVRCVNKNTETEGCENIDDDDDLGGIDLR